MDARHTLDCARDILNKVRRDMAAENRGRDDVWPRYGRRQPKRSV